jgi:hypothetical protein
MVADMNRIFLDLILVDLAKRQVDTNEESRLD